VLLEAGTPGDGATGRNAGFLFAESDCFGLAAERHGDTIAHAIRDAGLRTRKLVRELIGDTPETIDLRWTGSVRLAEDGGETAAFERSAAALADVARASVANVPERGVDTRYAAALTDDGDAILHPLKLLGAVLDSTRQAGGRIHAGTPVHAMLPAPGSVRLQTQHGDVIADHVVVATSTRPLGAAGVGGLSPVRAQALAATVTPDPGWLRPTYATRGGDYWRPLEPGRVLVGGLRRLRADDENTAHTAPSTELQASLDGLLRRLVGPEARLDVTHRWAGTMAFTADGLPIVGPRPEAPGVSVISGMNGHGMGWAPALAETLVAHLVDDAPAPAPFLRPRS
jgi:glycine/D-amino acid oxidase-like deaminating enzyme